MNIPPASDLNPFGVFQQHTETSFKGPDWEVVILLSADKNGKFYSAFHVDLHNPLSGLWFSPSRSCPAFDTVEEAFYDAVKGAINFLKKQQFHHERDPEHVKSIIKVVEKTTWQGSLF